MAHTLELLNEALEKQTISAWARAFNMSPSAITNATAKWRLSPVFAGNLAIEFGESPEHWVAIAAMETEPDSPLLTVPLDKSCLQSEA